MEKDFVKITSAIYKVLDFLPEGDPLKNKAKEKALEILEGLTVLDQKEKLLGNIKILENYLEVAKGQGWIDGMNFLIIKREYDIIKSRIHILKTVVDNEMPKPQLPMTNQTPITKILNPKKEKVVKVEKYTSRQQKILKILDKKKKAQVADLIKQLPDVTKRTIRRDLDDLLKKDAIVRIGDFNQAAYGPKW